MIATETATVYRGGGRRWFTKMAACRAEAKARLKTRCECERPDPKHGDGGYQCRYHRDENYTRLVRRLARIYFATHPTDKEQQS